MQAEIDRRAGLETAGYVTGYRGSPLGGIDQQFSRAGELLKAANVVFEPALNEDLAATAIWGAQQAEMRGEGRFTTASFACGTARVRAWTVPGTHFATPIWPAPPRTAVY